jgi:hypothetical protein
MSFESQVELALVIVAGVILVHSRTRERCLKAIGICPLDQPSNGGVEFGIIDDVIHNACSAKCTLAHPRRASTTPDFPIFGDELLSSRRMSLDPLRHLPEHAMEYLVARSTDSLMASLLTLSMGPTQDVPPC